MCFFENIREKDWVMGLSFQVRRGESEIDIRTMTTPGPLLQLTVQATAYV